MRLWHEALIPYLPRQQLLGQHRECCALRGNGWGKKHATVNYVFEHPYGWLVSYHWKVINEMEKRGYKTNKLWDDCLYRGKKCKPISKKLGWEVFRTTCNDIDRKYTYLEHNEAYLKECLENLKQKGIIINEQI